jgi:hypothetical protein
LSRCVQFPYGFSKRKYTMQLLIVLAIVSLGLASGCAVAVTEMKATADLMTVKEIAALLARLAMHRAQQRRLAG